VGELVVGHEAQSAHRPPQPEPADLLLEGPLVAFADDEHLHRMALPDAGDGLQQRA
jgi:hypothetical protein